MLKLCDNCVNCSKGFDGVWVCEEYGFYYGSVPVKVNPPYNEPCKMWTDNIDEANTWMKFI